MATVTCKDRMRVYIAGAYSADNVITVLDNMRKGMRDGAIVLQKGMAPFCPWLDYQFQLMLRGNESLAVQDYYEYSMAWLRVSDCMLVLPGWENSKGTRAEIDEAIRLNIPIFFTHGDLMSYQKDGAWQRRDDPDPEDEML
jgi:hypothetical protein